MLVSNSSLATALQYFQTVSSKVFRNVFKINLDLWLL